MLVDRVDRALRTQGVRDGDRLGVACSGGADSVALLHLLARAKLSLEVFVLHVDHGMRPDSGDDAAFVGDLAARLDLPFHRLTVTVDRRHPTGPEAAARTARYVAVERAAANLDLAWVATGHTLDDQAETVILRATRGGSIAGIAPVRGIVLRPLLEIERAQLRDWLRSEEISWREDPSNGDLNLERNWVRGVVLPTLRERRPGVARVLARAATDARADDAVLDALAREVFERADVDDTGVLLRSADVDALPPAVARRVLRLALRRVDADSRWSDLDAVSGLHVGGHVSCGRASVWRIDVGLAVFREPRPLPAPLTLPLIGTLETGEWGLRVRIGSDEARPWAWRCALPAEVTELTLRRRSPGDRVRTHGGTRKVQDVLVDAKVPRPLRDFVPLVVGRNGPLAVVGLTSMPGGDASSLVIDAEPAHPTWSKSAAWTPASA